MNRKESSRTRLGRWGPATLPWIQFSVGSLIWVALSLANQNLTFGILLAMSFAFFSSFASFWQAFQGPHVGERLGIVAVWMLFMVGSGMWAFLAFYGSRPGYSKVVSATAAAVFTFHAIFDVQKNGKGRR